MPTAIKMPARSLQYYVLAKRWLSDLEFFKIEAAYLHRLIDNYKQHLLDMEHQQQLTAIKADLLKLDDGETRSLLSEQIWQLELMADDIIAEDAESITATQVKLECFMTNLTNEFRLIKHQLYRLLLDGRK
ncbi:hypothetical protein JN11_01823 [Mucilaginibacter frigoritolerans]|uniref:Uncharacterized protein n=1 Tax=Mucilaginibacter frigoritolerans TaxID=652788 RepID=A0A562U767_9SPHI|nr:hypothetical protein [Mucilaginibacter frigoritolerans]TWJ01672.1 hypothetical protein JN11_01823 [Mucilaginibacter frigoritolerans]